MNKSITFRDKLKACNIDNVCKILYKRHAESPDGKQNDEKIYNAAYKKVIKTLLHKRKVRSSMPIEVKMVVDANENYYETRFVNLKYEAPPANLKPWTGKNPPTGHYNCDLNKYNRYWAFGNTSWAKITNSKVLNPENLSIDELVAEILWEITFYGYDEKTTRAFFKRLSDLVNDISSNDDKKEKQKKK
mgnify:CR=1 FL=1